MAPQYDPNLDLSPNGFAPVPEPRPEMKNTKSEEKADNEVGATVAKEAIVVAAHIPLLHQISLGMDILEALESGQSEPNPDDITGPDFTNQLNMDPRAALNPAPR